MTIPYAYRVATSRGIGNFYKILTVWHGSVWKMIWRDFFMYLTIYGCISVFYRNYLLVYEPEWAKKFAELVLHFRANNSRIPIVFVLSFFVGIINERWWNQVLLLPWPDQICLQASVLIRGQDRRGRLLRRTIARYVNLSIMFAFQLLSHDVRVRFPKLQSYCDAGLLLPHEMAILTSLKTKINYPFYYVPLVWTTNLVYRARREGRIAHDVSRRNLIVQIEKLRAQLLELLNYDVVFVPLAYTQVATIAVYVYFVVALIGNQFVDKPKEVDFYVPVFGLLEFVFFVGWLKIAEAMLNPYGNDDDDFELNWIIDRNIQVSYLMVDEIHRAVPTNLRKFYYETVLRKPYSVVTRRRDGTYSNETRPKRAEIPKPKPLEEEPTPSEMMFESFTVDEEKDFKAQFQEMLTKSPEPSAAASRGDVIVELPDESSEEEPELELKSVRSRSPSAVQSRKQSTMTFGPGSGESIAPTSSQRAHRMSLASLRTDMDATSLRELRQRRRSTAISRRSIAPIDVDALTELAGVTAPDIIQSLIQPDELIPLETGEDGEPIVHETDAEEEEADEDSEVKVLKPQKSKAKTEKGEDDK